MGGMSSTGGESTQPLGLWLFRYFDFDVEPGECYRYRVQLEVVNPNFGETFVDAPDVAEGETRKTPWSEPSTAAAVEKDVSYALTRISTKGTRPDGADLKVVQFDTNNGTLISDTFKVPFGAFVGKVMKSLHLDLIVRKLEEEEVTFSSKDILLDSAGAPNLSSAVATDLKLDTRQLAALKRGGELDMAVTVDRFGEIQELDAASKADLEPATEKMKKERKEYDEQRLVDRQEKKAKEKEDADAAKQSGKGGRRRKKDGQNPTRASSSMFSGSTGSGSMPPGMAGPGMSGPGSNSKSSRGR
jgi:hypothetical protein